jgi:hypothetical protein
MCEQFRMIMSTEWAKSDDDHPDNANRAALLTDGNAAG